MSPALNENQLNKPVRSRRSRDADLPGDETPVLFQLPDLSRAAAPSVEAEAPPEPRSHFKTEALAERFRQADEKPALEGAPSDDNDGSPGGGGSRDSHQRRRRRNRPAPEAAPAIWQATTTRIVLGASLVGLFIISWSILSGGANREEGVPTADPWQAPTAPMQAPMRVETIDYVAREDHAGHGAHLDAEMAQAEIDFVQPANDKPLAPPLAGSGSTLPASGQPEIAGKYDAPSSSADNVPYAGPQLVARRESSASTSVRPIDGNSPVEGAEAPPTGGLYPPTDLRSRYNTALDSQGYSQNLYPPQHVEAAEVGQEPVSAAPYGDVTAPYFGGPYEQTPSHRTAERSLPYYNNSRYEPIQGESAGQPGDPRRDAPSQQIRPRHERIGSGIY